MPDQPDPPRRHFTLKPRDFERVNAPPGTQATSADHDIRAIQRGIREKEKAAGFDNLKSIQPAKSRRRRDFWVGWLGTWALMLVVAGVTGGLVGLMAAFLLGIFLGVGLWWIMFHLIDDY